jgi:hypothetical protein
MSRTGAVNVSRRKSNPIRGPSQRTLFGGDEPVLTAWHQATVKQLEAAARQGDEGGLTDRDFAEMIAWRKLARQAGNIEPILAGGIDAPLARALAGDWVMSLGEMFSEANERRKIEEAGTTEQRTAPIIERVRAAVRADIEARKSDDEAGDVRDTFRHEFDDTARLRKSTVAQAKEFFASRTSRAFEGSDDRLMRFFKSSDDWYVARVNHDAERPSPFVLYTSAFDVTEGSVPGALSDKALKQEAEKLQPGDVRHIVDTLREYEPHIDLSILGARTFFVKSISYTAEETEDWAWEILFDGPVLVEEMKRLEQKERLESGPPPVEYKYSGQKGSILGVEGAGMYVLRLRPKDLAAEGKEAGICIGDPTMGYADDLEEGATEVFSIRSAKGKIRWTILRRKDGRDRWVLEQVKGKANRIPGFVLERPGFVKPFEVREVTEFLAYLDCFDECARMCSDMRPSLDGLADAGIDPWSAIVPKKKGEVQANPAPLGAVGAGEPEQIAVSPRVAQKAKEAMTEACAVPRRAPRPARRPQKRKMKR